MTAAVAVGPHRAPLSPAGFRAQFPLLQSRVHLASCSVAARSADLDATMALMLDDLAGAAPWDRFEEEVSAARLGFARLIGARPDQVALVPSATVGAYQVASTLTWEARPVIVTTPAEFPSIAHIWLAQRPRGAQVVVATPSGCQQAIDDRTRLVSVPLNTYTTGERLPVAEITRAAHAAGAQVLADAYQAAGSEPVDVAALGCDYLVAGPMKYLLGLPGVAFLYVRSPDGGDIDPQLTGWFGRTAPFAFNPWRLDFPPRATRFETGTPAVPACYAAGSGLRLIEKLDLQRVRDHISDLTGRAVLRLEEAGERVHGPASASERGAHIAIADDEPARLAAFLATRNVAVSPRGDLVRLAFHYFNNYEDVATVCEEIRRYRSCGDARTAIQ